MNELLPSPSGPLTTTLKHGLGMSFQPKFAIAFESEIHDLWVHASHNRSLEANPYRLWEKLGS